MFEPVPTTQPHIVLNASAQPMIEGTRIKVRELVLNHLAYGWSPEELAWQHPSLTLAQVYAALAYYYDHKEQLDREIQEGLERFDRLRRSNQDSPIRQKLRALGRL